MNLIDTKYLSIFNAHKLFENLNFQKYLSRFKKTLFHLQKIYYISLK